MNIDCYFDLLFGKVGMDFWTRLDDLMAAYKLVVDRPKGSRHPRYPEFVYPLDYGYLEGTSGGDGGGIDVWVGLCRSGGWWRLPVPLIQRKETRRLNC